MARAGFYAIHNSSIRFGRDGRWYADGQPISNPRIADEQAAIEVEDTPYVVTAAGDDAHGVWIELNDRSRESLDPTSLAVGEADVLYCRVKGGSEPARFLRPAYYQLAPRIEPAPNGGFVYRDTVAAYPIGRR